MHVPTTILRRRTAVTALVVLAAALLAASATAALQLGGSGREVLVGRDNDNAANSFIQPLGVAAKLLQLELALVGEEQVVHRPEPALRPGGFRRERGVQRVRMDLFQREVPPCEPHAAFKVREDQLDRGRRLLAVRALEIAVLDNVDGRMRAAKGVIAQSLTFSSASTRSTACRFNMRSLSAV